jgi:hypothetical protein
MNLLLCRQQHCGAANGDEVVDGEHAWDEGRHAQDAAGSAEDGRPEATAKRGGLVG